MAEPSRWRDAALRARAAIVAAPPWVPLVSGWVLLLVYAYPGLMTQDSYDHLREVRERVYTDSHPPAINLLWAVSDYIVQGPIGLLILQSSGLVYGLYRAFRLSFEPKRAAWIATAMFVFPPVFLPMAVIWKDCLMAGWLVIAFALLVKGTRRAQVGALVMMFLATCVRYNAPAATLPLVFFLFEWSPGLRWWKRYPLAIAAWIAITFAAFFTNAKLTDKEMYLWHSSHALFDMAGVLSNLDEDLPDAELQERFAGTDIQVTENIHASIRRLYSPRDFLPLVWPDKYPPMWKMPINGFEPAPKAQRDAVERAWKYFVTTYPAEYLQHRVNVFLEVLALTGHRSDGGLRSRTVMWPEFARELGIQLEASKLQRKWTKGMAWLVANTPFFTPWMYVLIALILLPIAWRHRDLRALLASGLTFEFALLPIAPSPDYRYSHWLVICTLISVIVLIARRAKSAPETVRVPADS